MLFKSTGWGERGEASLVLWSAGIPNPVVAKSLCSSRHRDGNFCSGFSAPWLMFIALAGWKDEAGNALVPKLCAHSRTWLQGKRQDVAHFIPALWSYLNFFLWDPLKERLSARWQNRNKVFLYMNCLLGYWDYLASVSRTQWCMQPRKKMLKPLRAIQMENPTC